ncbi:hypothetical protein ASG52_02035 [Methylobacterium sp. Leaf456]|uniref:Hint domain-containing protein n=1 Tax=Methylobacterium sp. Leaf456 TaxID=1736382 RepID=UPI0006F4D937|nr:Hint domain-containing protein [Methylobacterium sp. Leaf456]KQT61676.1 hypothetical protein ASG52_02035 [Methylobacterium sp. Leaf456]
MPTIRYRFTGPNGFVADFTITTESTTRNYDIAGNQETGYAITGVSGTINGQSVTLKPSANQGTNPANGTTNTTNPNTFDNANTGGGSNSIGTYNNVYFLNDGEGGGAYSNYGLDGNGIGLTAGGVDYKFFNQAANTEQFQYRTTSSGGTNVISFQVTQIDGNGNETPAPCYVTGTRILTARGAVAVEDLAVGDLAVTASGAERPIRWIGHKTVRCRARADLLPVRIAAGAFGEGRPARDLMVSPGHAVCVDVLGEVLIPAIRLVNGTTITQVEVAEVTYWHVELESHDILLAEGLPAESYLDMGNRAFFEVASIGLGPDAPVGRTTADFCRPFHEDGALVEAVRARLQARAEALGWSLVEAPLADLHLVVDGQTVRPDTDGLVARFILPAGARDVRLVSEVSVPAYVRQGTSDDRRLGVCLAALSLDDGLTGLRAIALDDARLEAGLHPLDTDGAAHWRWTEGATPLPASLWEGCRGTMFLRVNLAAPSLPRWVGPQETAGIVDLAERRRRA